MLPQSSSSTVNALLDEFSWTGGVGSSPGGSISYSYTLVDWLYDSTAGTTARNVALLNSTQQAAVDTAFAQWSRVANITFERTDSASEAQIVLRQADLPANVLGWMQPFVSGTQLAAGDVVVDSSFNFNPTVGSSGYVTFLHEIGHALGLGHPHEGVRLPSSEDTLDYTVMSYNVSAIDPLLDPSTPMIYDIATLQYIYGANTNYNSEDTVYNLGTAGALETFWDGGGTDTIVADSTTAATIDLGEGVSHVTSTGSAHYWIAVGANIEHATGSSADDTLLGNSLSNILYGGAGNDTILGYDNADTIAGHAGNDSINGNAGNDTIWALDGNDTAHGGQDDDLVNGNQGNDFVTGSRGNDTVLGGKGVDVVRGGKENDLVNGNFGNDLVHGDLGNDTVRGGQNDDTLYGGAGDDVLYGDKGSDILVGGDGNDVFHFGLDSGVDLVADFDGPGVGPGDSLQFSSSVFERDSEVLSATTYASSTATITLSATDSVTLVFVGIGAFLTADDITIV